jgi:protein TIF31
MLKILFEQQKLNEQTETVSATEETRKNSENEDQQVESNTVSSSEKSPLLTPEIIEAMRNVQDEPFEFSLNPNVFLPSIKYGVEAEVAESDENTARSIASMLWNQVLPHITEQIRTGEVVPQEGRALTDYLHQRGVNMRYLGRLAELARKQEDEDVAMLNGGHQRRQPMPYYWLELLEIEIAARVMKHILNREITASKSTHAAPAFTIAKLLNHLFGSDEMTVEQSLQFINDAKSKKSIKKAGVQSPTSSVPESQASSISKNNFWKLFGEIAISKFGHSNSLLFSIASDTFVASRKFHQRISPMSLLRRLCQLSGVRISAVHYDFSHSTPFTTENIVDIVPVAKSCEPDFPLLEARQMVDAAKVQLQHLNIAAAFELCQDASRWIQQVRIIFLINDITTVYDFF